MWMADSLIRLSTGKQMMLPSPNEPNRWATRDRGPMAPSERIAVHPQRTTSDETVKKSLRTRFARVGARGSRSSIRRNPVPYRPPLAEAVRLAVPHEAAGCTSS